jgi:hypothetical protein
MKLPAGWTGNGSAFAALMQKATPRGPRAGDASDQLVYLFLGALEASADDDPASRAASSDQLSQASRQARTHIGSLEICALGSVDRRISEVPGIRPARRPGRRIRHHGLKREVVAPSDEFSRAEAIFSSICPMAEPSFCRENVTLSCKLEIRSRAHAMP